MTECSYQAARKLMQRINHLRGLITKLEGEVAKWTRMESSYRENFKHGQADGAKKMLDKSLLKLKELRDKFAAMEFPDSNMTEETLRCLDCGRKLKMGENCYCIYQ